MEPIEKVKGDAREVGEGIKQVNRDILVMAGGDRMVNWDKYFGMGLYGAFLSIACGLLILGFPALVSYIVGIFLIARGAIEAFKYAQRKVKQKVAKLV
jgi:uncharacterized membrane protein HdeD (DUF308 family)